MDIQRKLEVVLAQGRQQRELAEGVGAQPVRSPLILDWTVCAPPAGYAGERSRRGALDRRPPFQHQGWQRGDPLESAGGNGAVGLSDVGADGDERIMSG